jgi:hypothetical protein
MVAGIRKNRWQAKKERSKSQVTTVAAGFQRVFPAREAIREPSWQLQGAGAIARAVLFAAGENQAGCPASATAVVFIGITLTAVHGLPRRRRPGPGGRPPSSAACGEQNKHTSAAR